MFTNAIKFSEMFYDIHKCTTPVWTAAQRLETQYTRKVTVIYWPALTLAARTMRVGLMPCIHHIWSMISDLLAHHHRAGPTMMIHLPQTDGRSILAIIRLGARSIPALQTRVHTQYQCIKRVQRKSVENPYKIRRAFWDFFKMTVRSVHWLSNWGRIHHHSHNYKHWHASYGN